MQYLPAQYSFPLLHPHCAGFTVIDLGIDVPTEKFVEEVKKNKAPVSYTHLDVYKRQKVEIYFRFFIRFFPL